MVFCVSNNELCISFKNKGWAGEDGPLLKRMGATMEVRTYTIILAYTLHLTTRLPL